MRVREAKPARHDRAQAIGADDESRVQLFGGTVVAKDRDSANPSPPSCVAREIRDAHALCDVRARRPRALQQRVVQDGATDREAAIAESAKAVRGGVIASRRRAAGRANDHSAQLRAARLEGGEHAHVVEQP